MKDAGWIWRELALEPTADLVAIRRAYASRLKRVRPEDDRQGFQQLRTAYETAIALARRQHAPQLIASPETALPELELATGTAAQQRPISDSAPPAPSVADQALKAVTEPLQLGDIETAASAMATAVAKDLLPLGTQMRLSEQLAAALLRNSSVSLERQIAIARELGWLGAATSWQDPKHTAVQLLLSRIEAQDWLAKLRRQAEHFSFYLGGHEAGAARLLLGRGPILESYHYSPEPPLSKRLAELHHHRRWIASSFDEKRLRRLQKLVRRKHSARFMSTAAIQVIVLSMLILPEESWVVPLAICWTFALLPRIPKIFQTMLRSARPILAALLLLNVAAALIVWHEQRGIWPLIREGANPSTHTISKTQ